MHRLYIFAGKGGVGKTSLSLAFTQYLLENEKRNVLYTFFEQNHSSHLFQKLNIPYRKITAIDSIGAYMERKIGSKIVAKTILKTPFFKSLFHVIPGISYISLLGEIVNTLKKDTELTMVLDPPATGHILTMFASLENFKEIFGKGIFAKDIEQINTFIATKNFLKISVIALPSEMALKEAVELKSSLTNYCHDNIDFIVNDSLLQSHELEKEKLPDFLCEKIELEKAVLKNISATALLPHIFSNNVENVIKKLSSKMEKLV